MERAISRVGYLSIVALLLSGLMSAPSAQSYAAIAEGGQSVSNPACEEEPVSEFTEAFIADLRA
ncbi:MAG: hypothetical protein ACM3JD_14470, partial [Rudaea sp.]